MALFRCFGGTGACQPASRDYIVDYPSFVKMNATLTQQITLNVSGFVSVNNLTNSSAFEGQNVNPAIGRISTVGVQLKY